MSTLMSKEKFRDPAYLRQLFEQAERFFTQHPEATKFSRKSSLDGFSTPISFIKSEKGAVFALTGHRLRKPNNSLVQGADAKSVKIIQSKEGSQFFLKRYRTANTGPRKNVNWPSTLEISERVYGNNFHTVERRKDPQNVLYHITPYLGRNLNIFILDEFTEKLKSADKNAFTKNVFTLFKKAIVALQTFHKTGFLHGDIKGDNLTVIIDQGGQPTLHLIDFGNAHHYDPDQPYTLNSPDIYTQVPAWARDGNHPSYTYTFTQRTDWYSMGAIFKRVSRIYQKTHLLINVEKLRPIIAELQKKPNEGKIDLGKCLRLLENAKTLIPTYALATSKGKLMCAGATVNWMLCFTAGFSAWSIASSLSLDAAMSSALFLGLAITALISLIAAIPATTIVANDNNRYFKDQQKTSKKLPSSLTS